MTHQVISVDESIEGNQGVDCWRVGVKELSSGRCAQHVFPKVVLEWRAAEYGVEHTDTETLLSMVIHEGYMDEAATGVSIAAVSLSTAKNSTEARTKHLARIKAHPVSVDMSSKLLQKIHKVPINKEAVVAKREQVDLARWYAQYGELPLPEPTGTPSHPPLPVSDSMGVSPKAKESLTVIVGGQ